MQTITDENFDDVIHGLQEQISDQIRYEIDVHSTQSKNLITMAALLEMIKYLKDRKTCL